MNTGHPNIFDSYLCLSMIKKHTASIPYEGWSASYTLTSVLMQLQSFLFAEKIDQEFGGQIQARADRNAIVRLTQFVTHFFFWFALFV